MIDMSASIDGSAMGYSSLAESMDKMCPSMQGRVALRYSPTSEQIASSSFISSYLSLEMGSLRWSTQSPQPNSVNCGYLISKAHIQDSSSSGKSKAIGRKPNARQVLALQIMTKDGTYDFELSLPVSIFSLWYSALDLHFAHCSQHTSTLPPHAFDDVDCFPISYDISTKIKVFGTDDEVVLGLLDDAESITQDIINSHGLDSRMRTQIENSILLEQRWLAADLFSLYRKAEAFNHRLVLRCIKLEERAKSAESHAKCLDQQFDQMESLLPLLKAKLAGEKVSNGRMVESELNDQSTLPYPPVLQPIAIRTDSAVLEHKEPSSPSTGYRSRSRSPGATGRSASPTYAFPTASSKADNIWNKYEETRKALAETTEALTKAKADLHRERMVNEHSSKQLQLNQVLAENHKLREVSISMREELMSVQRQLEEIQSAARRTVTQLAQEQRSLPSQQQPLVMGTQRRPSMINRPIVLETITAHREIEGGHEGDEEEYSQLDQAESSSPRYFASGDDRMPYEDVYPLQFINGWTVNYQDVIPHQTDARFQRLVLLATHALRWKAVEESLFYDLYSRYMTQSKGGLTITMFMRMMKDFAITTVESNERMVAGKSPVRSAIIADYDHNRLTYSDLNMIFMQAGRLLVDDLPRRAQAFKVAHHGEIVDYKTMRRKGKAQELATSHINSAGVNSVLTRKQFLATMQNVADKIFSSLVRRVAGTEANNLTLMEQSKLKRTSLELMMVKVLLPHAIIHDVLSWSLVYIQEFLNALHREAQLCQFLAEQMPLVVEIFRKYSHRNPLGPPLARLGETSAVSSQALLTDQLLDYQEISQCARDYGLVPYIVNEQQLFRLFQELCTFHLSDSDAQIFPSFTLPPVLSKSLLHAMAEAWKEDGVQAWTEQQQAVLGEQLQAMGLVSPGADRKKAKTAADSASAEIREDLGMERFVVCLGAIAVHQEIIHLPTVLEKVEKFFDLLHQRHYNLKN